MRRYSWPWIEGTGKRPVRSAAVYSERWTVRTRLELGEGKARRVERRIDPDGIIEEAGESRPSPS
jgi:hypothetical protein